MLNPPSPDINVLAAEVLWDISGTNPVIVITNKSQGSGLANVSWWLEVYSPSRTPIHSGSSTSPDIVGAWTTKTLTNNWPRPYDNIEWSGAPYTLEMFAKDSNGNVYSVPFSASICKPFGNTKNSTTPYGLATTDVQIKCEMARVLFQNQTNVSYKGQSGVLNSSYLKVIYPLDETQNIPAPFELNGFSTALVPISYSSNNYQFLTQQYYTYDLGGGSFVKIRYQQQKTFAVYCNINLYPLICEYNKLIEELENGSCVNSQEASQKLMVINSKMAMVFIGMIQPLTGVDVPALIKEIEFIGGFSCDCCSAPTGIIPTTASVIDGYSFSVNNLGGDVDGSFSKVGTNIILDIWDKSYIFAIAPSTLSVTDAFQVSSTQTGDGYTKTYYLNVNLETLATDLATTIQENGTLLNLWKTVLGIGSAAEIIVDGGCLFQSNSACDYYFTLSNIPVSGTFASFSGIRVNNVNQTKSFAFNQTNLSGFQSYLNGMGLGVWSVANAGGGVVQVNSLNNTSNISGLTYKIAGTTYVADLSIECTGYDPITIDEFASLIVNYLCAIDDSQILTSAPYQVCYIDSLGNKQIASFDAGVSLQAVILSLTINGCQTVDYVKGLGAVNCEALKAVFPSNSSLNITGTDFALGTKGNGVCSRVPYIDIFRYMLNATKSDAFTMNLFCEVSAMCGAGLVCEPFSYFEVIVTDYNTVCTEATGIEYTLS